MVVLDNIKNSYFRSDNRLLVGIDLEDLIVVETRDAILIANKKSSQKVKCQKVEVIQRFLDLGAITFQLLKEIDGK